MCLHILVESMNKGWIPVQLTGDHVTKGYIAAAPGLSVTKALLTVKYISA